ncbi:MAG: hypothetical protein ACOC1U_05120, partial [Spirochaetota bacterium]
QDLLEVRLGQPGALGDVVRTAASARPAAEGADERAAGSLAGSPVLVRTEVRSASGSAVEAASTLERELAVLASHTVHHYAIIALLLRVQDVDVPASFGVAPSTLRHEAAGSE